MAHMLLVSEGGLMGIFPLDVIISMYFYLFFKFGNQVSLGKFVVEIHSLDYALPRYVVDIIFSHSFTSPLPLIML